MTPSVNIAGLRQELVLQNFMPVSSYTPILVLFSWLAVALPRGYLALILRIIEETGEDTFFFENVDYE